MSSLLLLEHKRKCLAIIESIPQGRWEATALLKEESDSRRHELLGKSPPVLPKHLIW